MAPYYLLAVLTLSVLAFAPFAMTATHFTTSSIKLGKQTDPSGGIKLHRIRKRVSRFVALMRAEPDNETIQQWGCQSLAVPTTSATAQNVADEVGAIEAAAAAMDRFPNSKAVQVSCTQGLSTIVLFNRNNGLKAGRLGTLNHSIETYGRWMSDPLVNTLGGALGSFFDFCDENRAIARELGGIRLLIQNIKNNFHGKLGEWNYEPVKQSLFGLSSGCWRNEDICNEQGFPQLAMDLMREHGGEDKIAEETMQALKALIHFSEQYRENIVQLGALGLIGRVIESNPVDRGAIDLSCETMSYLVGPGSISGPGPGFYGQITDLPFNADFQRCAVKEGARDQVVRMFMEGRDLRHKEHSFNFDVNSAYNVNRDCLRALGDFLKDDEQGQEAAAQAGLPARVAEILSGLQPSDDAWDPGCALLRMLTGERTAAESGAPSRCDALK